MAGDRSQIISFQGTLPDARGCSLSADAPEPLSCSFARNTALCRVPRNTDFCLNRAFSFPHRRAYVTQPRISLRARPVLITAPLSCSVPRETSTCSRRRPVLYSISRRDNGIPGCSARSTKVSLESALRSVTGSTTCIEFAEMMNRGFCMLSAYAARILRTPVPKLSIYPNR